MSHPLSFYADVDSGQGAPQGEQNFVGAGEGLPFVRAGSLEFLCRGESIDNCEHVSPGVAQKYRLKQYPKDSIVFAKSGMSAKIGRVYRLEKDAYVVNHLAVVMAKNNVNPRYLQYWLQANPPSKLIRDDAYPSIRLSEIKNYSVSLPEDTTKQDEIVCLLDKAFEVSKKRRTAQDILEELLRATFLDIFGDPVTNPKGWEIIPLSKYIDTLTSGSRGWAKYYSSEGAKFLRIQNVGFGELKTNDMAFVTPPEGAEARRTHVHPQEVLLSITADLGRTAVIPDDFGEGYINQHLAKFSLKGVCPYFVASYICSKGGLHLLSKKDKGGVKAGLNFNDIKTLPIFKVSEDSQKLWREARSKILKQKNTNLESEEDINILFKSLTQKAFEGALS